LLVVLSSLNNNVCAFEKYYLESGRAWRDVAAPLLEMLPAAQSRDLADYTTCSAAPSSSVRARYPDQPFIAEPVLFVSIPSWLPPDVLAPRPA
jgi:hypothetical protein